MLCKGSHLIEGINADLLRMNAYNSRSFSRTTVLMPWESSVKPLAWLVVEQKLNGLVEPGIVGRHNGEIN